MKKTLAKRMTLVKTTVRELSAPQLSGVHGNGSCNTAYTDINDTNTQVAECPAYTAGAIVSVLSRLIG
jgi:hypothetical protein